MDAFHPIAGPRAADEIVDQIAFAIRAGLFQVGDRLPSVPELAQMTGVSRPTIGEAVRQLSEVGVLEVRRGATGGIRVISSSVPARALRRSTARRPGTLRELLEARRPIEVELARLATIRATEEDFETLQRANDHLLSVDQHDLEHWAHANNAFHYAIGRAARSDTLAHFQHQILQELTVLLDGYSERYSDPAVTIREHVETLEAMRSRDPDAAAAAMAAQMEEYEQVAQWYDDLEADAVKARRKA
jgi:GntR family transcriptional repressor for pyruvate dehydrogenase complex